MRIIKKATLFVLVFLTLITAASQFLLVAATVVQIDYHRVLKEVKAYQKAGETAQAFEALSDLAKLELNWLGSPEALEAYVEKHDGAALFILFGVIILYFCLAGGIFFYLRKSKADPIRSTKT